MKMFSLLIVLVVIVLLLVINVNSLNINQLSKTLSTTTKSINDDKYFKFNSEFGTYDIRYKYVKKSNNNNNNFFLSLNNKSTPVLCIHGFGGNSDQWRKNLPIIAENGYDSYAIDLLGYGYSDKPNPKLYDVNQLYNFDTWTEQTVDFIKNIIKEPVVLVTNSVGGVNGLNIAIKYPELVKGVILIDISLRLLHERKQNFFIKPFVKLIQTTLRETDLGKTFFNQVATPKSIKNILSQAYASDVDDETVDIILKPGLEEGAAEVFLDFISYSGGPLPEDLLPQCNVPVRILWGQNDPWYYYYYY